MLQLHHRNLSGSDGSGGDHNNMSANSSTSCDYRGEDMEEFADKAPSPFELLQLLKPLVVSESKLHSLIQTTSLTRLPVQPRTPF